MDQLKSNLVLVISQNL